MVCILLRWGDIEHRKNKLYCLWDNHLKRQTSIFCTFFSFPSGSQQCSKMPFCTVVFEHIRIVFIQKCKTAESTVNYISPLSLNSELTKSSCALQTLLSLVAYTLGSTATDLSWLKNWWNFCLKFFKFSKVGRGKKG